jgi:signal transduction histidine kinase/CheY-like chemotaxis protein
VEASGEVAELKDNFNAMVSSLRETTRTNRDQDWLKSSLAEVTRLTQGRRDLAEVAGLVMSRLAPLVQAQYGAFFLAEDGPEGTELRLIASYADPGDPRAPRRFRLGQSLVGQAARDRVIIALDDVPPDYLRIASGLGGTAPASLLVLPIAAEGQTLGVIELASVHRFTAVQRSFLEQLMDSIGVNLNTIVANARTDELLGESQRLTVELRARQRELQSSNEELEAKNLEIEQARQELEERARQLALASTYKSEFLANMSHELRTPLNSLLILAQLLAQNAARNLTPKQVEYAEVIHSAGSDLLQLINDILDLSKVEAGKMVVEPEPVAVPRLLEDLETTFRPLTGQKGLRFAVASAPDVPAEVVTDGGRVQQVLRNLLSNAVKFTESGRVDLEAGLARPGEAPASVRADTPVLAFRVKDTGIGIPESQLENVFGAFQQADGTTSRKYGGTGLGLSISREIAALLGGAIGARSRVGVGSEFTLYLPARPPSREPEQRESGTSAIGLTTSRVLVIEQPRRGPLTRLAESAAAELAPAQAKSVVVETAIDAREAALLASAERSAPVRCAVLKLDLPDGGTARLLEAIAAEPSLRELPMLAYQAPDLDPSSHRLLLSHARRHPLELIATLDELRQRVAEYLAVDSAGRTGHAEPAPERPAAVPADDGRLAGRTVLVVDDDTRNVFALASMLEFYGMRVLHAGNGRTGINILRQNPEIDLVLMDVMMPEMDGYEATELIRSDPRYEHLPIIAVTAKAMAGDREKSLAAGATDYIAKPVEAHVLVERIRRQLVR